MMENLHRDEDIVPLVKWMMQGYRGYLGEPARPSAGRSAPVAERKTSRRGLAMPLSFPAWRSLGAGAGLSDEEGRRLMCE